jgi:hypothetical protein
MIRVLDATVGLAPELLEHAANVNAAIASKPINRFDIYILLGLLPDATRTRLRFINRATYPEQSGWAGIASGDTMRGSLGRVKRQVLDPTTATIRGQSAIKPPHPTATSPALFLYDAAVRAA